MYVIILIVIVIFITFIMLAQMNVNTLAQKAEQEWSGSAIDIRYLLSFGLLVCQLLDESSMFLSSSPPPLQLLAMTIIIRPQTYLQDPINIGRIHHAVVFGQSYRSDHELRQYLKVTAVEVVTR